MQRKPSELRGGSQQRGVNLGFLLRVGMHYHVVTIRIVIRKELSEGLALCIGVDVLLAEVPIQREVVSIAGDQFPVI